MGRRMNKDFLVCLQCMRLLYRPTEWVGGGGRSRRYFSQSPMAVSAALLLWLGTSTNLQLPWPSQTCQGERRRERWNMGLWRGRERERNYWRFQVQCQPNQNWRMPTMVAMFLVFFIAPSHPQLQLWYSASAPWLDSSLNWGSEKLDSETGWLQLFSVWQQTRYLQ